MRTTTGGIMEINQSEMDEVYEHLRRNPDLCMVHPSGRVLIALVDLEEDHFMAIKAPDGVDFTLMTDEELNDHIVATLRGVID
jgi:hypothetical protein